LEGSRLRGMHTAGHQPFARGHHRGVWRPGCSTIGATAALPYASRRRGQSGLVAPGTQRDIVRTEEIYRFMGVNIYLLDRRPVQLVVAGTLQHIGALRGFWKVTEMDDERVRELRAAETAASLMPSPKAAMIADVEEKPLAREADTSVRAHCVIGWDEGRTSVTDMRWDFLPVLGYAVRNPDGAFVLHEERDDGLHGLERERALQLGLIDREGRLVRRGQPVILDVAPLYPSSPGMQKPIAHSTTAGRKDC
jgi:hypothetical protein